MPTRELAGQVTKVITSLAAFCAQDIRTENLTRKEDDRVQRARLAEKPDIVIATPGRAATHLKNTVLSLENLTHIVIDEADLVLSYGYDDDLQVIAKELPKGIQAFLMSATFRAELDQLKGLFCRNPVVLELDDQEEQSKVTQYIVKCAEDEKFLLVYAIFMLKLIKGKVIIFVGEIDRCYRLKLFLEQFGLKSCVLNSELPVNSRIHVVDEFNKGVYDVIIATDEHEIFGDEDQPKNDQDEAQDAEMQDVNGGETNGVQKNVDGGAEGAEKEQKPKKDRQKKKRRRVERDKDYGVARGIDFKNVACVLNFDLPTSGKSYTHRIGRTARGDKSGMALSFVVPKEHFRKHKYTSIASAEHDEEVLAKIQAQQSKKGNKIEPYEFDMSKLEGFRYRLQSALAAVTGGSIREARLKELKQELIKSEKLKRHFEENPDELRHLRHDGELRAAKVQPHLKHVPDYLLPVGGTKKVGEELGFVSVGKHVSGGNRIRRVRAANKAKGKGRRKSNPLQSFKGKVKT